TIVALETAKENGAFIFGVVNAVGSSIARISHAGAYTHAGPEIGVASTKAFTGQLAVLMMMALKIGKEKGTITQERYQSLLIELADVPEKVAAILKDAEQMKQIATEYADASDFLFLGRGVSRWLRVGVGSRFHLLGFLLFRLLLWCRLSCRIYRALSKGVVILGSFLLFRSFISHWLGVGVSGRLHSSLAEGVVVLGLFLLRLLILIGRKVFGRRRGGRARGQLARLAQVVALEVGPEAVHVLKLAQEHPVVGRRLDAALLLSANLAVVGVVRRLGEQRIVGVAQVIPGLGLGLQVDFHHILRVLALNFDVAVHQRVQALLAHARQTQLAYRVPGALLGVPAQVYLAEGDSVQQLGRERAQGGRR
ncbi:MAG: SIS domain-containing protein, partial [Hymenobacter sp.]